MGLALAVSMRLEALDNPWQSHRWEVDQVHVDMGQFNEPAQYEIMIGNGFITAYQLAPSDFAEQDKPVLEKWLFKGFHLDLFVDEAEGYYLNVSSPEPSWLVMWRMEDCALTQFGQLAIPNRIMLSYNEAGRLLDGGEQVDRMPLPNDILDSVRQYVASYYQPEPKKRARPASFDGANRPKNQIPRGGR